MKILVEVIILMAITSAIQANDLRSINCTNLSLSGIDVIENVSFQEGTWEKTNNAVRSTDTSAVYARAYVSGHEWIDCIFDADITIEKTADQPWAGLRLIVHGYKDSNEFITVGLNYGRQTVSIELSNGLKFSTLAEADYRIQLGRTYHMQVITDRAGIYCYINGKCVVHQADTSFIKHPAGMVGFYSAAAVGTFDNITVKSAKRSSSPFKTCPANPLNIDAYSPSVIFDKGTYKMWFTTPKGQGYAESKDGISWTQPAGTDPVKPLGESGSWGDSGEADAEVVRYGNKFIMWHPACSSINGNWWDGMGVHYSKDGIHWTTDAKNPEFKVGPVGAWDENCIGDHSFIKDGDTWKMWYTGINCGERGYRNEFGYAESKDCIHWKKSTLNPVITQGDPGDWDGGWLSAASILKLDDDELQTRVYAGKPGASYHCFYHGHITNNEFTPGVKRIGWAFSLDGVNWVKYDDIATDEPPFANSDPIITWSDWDDWGYLGIRACSAIRDGDEIKIWYSGEGCSYSGTGMASAKISDLLKIVEEAKASGKLKVTPKKDIEATLIEPLPISVWDDLADDVLSAGIESGEARADAGRAKELILHMNKSEQAYLENDLAPLSHVSKLFALKGGGAKAKLEWTLDIASMAKLSPGHLHNVKYDGIKNGYARFTVTGDDPYIVIPVGDIKIGNEPLNLVRIDQQIDHPTREFRLRWAEDNDEYDPNAMVSRALRFPEAQQRLCLTMPWKHGNDITALRLDISGTQEFRLKSLEVYSVGIDYLDGK